MTSGCIKLSSDIRIIYDLKLCDQPQDVMHEIGS
jgi:hypothetical protein